VTFSEAYATHGPDTMAIARALRFEELLGLSRAEAEAKAEALIYDHMSERYAKKVYHQKLVAALGHTPRRQA
jgi:hypothetical protein